MGERYPRGRGVERRMGFVEGAQRRVARRGGCAHILLQELNFLHDAAADDLVAAVEAHGEALAVEDLLIDVVGDQRAQHGGRGRAAELLGISTRKLRDARFVDDDAVLVVAAAAKVRRREDRSAYEKEMQQRLARRTAQGGYEPCFPDRGIGKSDGIAGHRHVSSRRSRGGMRDRA